jgi:N-acetylmuramoyl-L-alanine amidase
MRKYFLPISLFLLAINAYALPAPSALDARERRLNRPTPTPTPQTQIQPQIQAQPFTQPQPQPQTRTQTRVPTQTQTRSAAVLPDSARSQIRTTTPTTKAVSREGPRPSTTVVIDAGHGGHDRGGIAGQRVDEKTMNLDVSLRLRSILQSYGYRVVMTRDTDVFIPLGTRVAIANSYRDAIFVCVHFNATSRRSASGIETYFYSSQSLPLASAIHYYVAGGAPSANRGVRRRGFFVLRRTTIPSVLVECGFLTNPTEASYAQNASYRQKLALEIAHGIQNRASVSRIPGATRIASTSASTALEPETVPLQPFLDQTHYRDPDLSRSKHRRSSKSSKSTSSNRKKSSDSDSDSDTPKKKSTKKKKSVPAKTED